MLTRPSPPSVRRRWSARVSSSARRRSNSSSRSAGGRLWQKATRTGKARSSDTSGSDSISTQPLPPGVGDAVHLLAPGAAAAAAGGPRRWARKAASSPASEPLIGADGPGRCRPAGHGLDQAGLLEPAERRVERAERDGQAQAQQVAEALAQLVAVEVVLFEEAEDGEFQHVIRIRWMRSPTGGRAAMHRDVPYRVRSYRFDISIGSLPESSPFVNLPSPVVRHTAAGARPTRRQRPARRYPRCP